MQGDVPRDGLIVEMEDFGFPVLCENAVGMTRDQDLTDALKFLLEGKGAEAVVKATPWKESWVAKCIIYLANSFLLVDIMTAIEVFGGEQGLNDLLASQRVEKHFLQGYGGIFLDKPAQSESAFESAAKILPNDPFVQFGLAFAYLRNGKQNKFFDAISRMAQQHPSHPALHLLRELIS